MSVNVYVGMEKEQALAFEVLKYSILKNSQSLINVIPLSEALESKRITIPQIKTRDAKSNTPFSYQRFAIPLLNESIGKAIYLDSDMIVFQDIQELYDSLTSEFDLVAVKTPDGSKRETQISVMVLDCGKLEWEVREIIGLVENGNLTYKKLFNELPIAKSFGRVIPSKWNELERYDQKNSALTHYTDMFTQPWLWAGNPIGYAWCEMLLEALSNGAISLEFLKVNVEYGWVRPSLLYQAENNIADPSMLPSKITRHDSFSFTPPHAIGFFCGPMMSRVIRNFMGIGRRKPKTINLCVRKVHAFIYELYWLINKLRKRKRGGPYYKNSQEINL